MDGPSPAVAARNGCIEGAPGDALVACTAPEAFGADSLARATVIVAAAGACGTELAPDRPAALLAAMTA